MAAANPCNGRYIKHGVELRKAVLQMVGVEAQAVYS
jgi:hypothetical protein